MEPVESFYNLNNPCNSDKECTTIAIILVHHAQLEVRYKVSTQR